MKFIVSGALLLLVFLPGKLFSQTACRVFLTDKAGVTFDPVTYFDSKALERREKMGIPVNDITDWPLNPSYVEQVGAIADSVCLESRWFNMVAVYATDQEISRLRQLPFVSRVEQVEPVNSYVASIAEIDTSMDDDDRALLKNQLLSLQGDKFAEAGIDGKGVRIAIFDVGFPGAKESPVFQHIFSSGRLIATRDFSKKKGEDVFWGKPHGTEVWSCIAGKLGEQSMGLATGAEFLLAKTEVNREPFSEELHWLAAAEWADKMGADIINSSLGYTNNRYFPWQMDGKTSFISRAANMAARKGILVVNAAGNEGDGSWHKVGAPADADSVLSVGGINPETGFHTGFSSFGPTADNRLKPNVSAFGHVIVAAGSKLVTNQGTSFSSPLVAGFAACALQINKGMSNMTLFQEIEKSGHLYPYFDYAHGYGVPQASYFLEKEHQRSEPTFTVSDSAGVITVRVKEKYIHPVEETESGDSYTFDKNKYMYYNLTNPAGVIDLYYVLSVTSPEVITIEKSEYQPGEVLNIHYAGYTSSYKL